MSDVEYTTAEDWMTPTEVAKLFSVDPKTVARWNHRGVMEKNGVRVVLTPGGHRRYNRTDIYRAFVTADPIKKDEE
jgi:predicted site-specific integrase-resolvase